MLLGKLDESAGRVSSMVSLVLRRSGISFSWHFLCWRSRPGANGSGRWVRWPASN